ncbi:glycogen debranching protein GlgX [Actinobaculum suis]|uniref:Glycogen debranching protein GlgX n=1 Tax=Actinobaculum suis TaxID=1657 RepID=A0AAW9HMW5_9ACTO|nr:glycogen debranching protein GlgX [Actinobaculum suis]MDY5154067.1 glycogen debranching protein GlgX [Actinobaculum suis]
MTSFQSLPLTSTRYVARASERAFPPRNAPVRLGAHIADSGVDFAVTAPNATAVDLCLFTMSAGRLQETRYALHRTGEVWAGHVANARAGQEYGYRVHGPWEPERGMCFNPAKLLLDPYGRAVTGTPKLCRELYAHKVDDTLKPASYPLARDDADSAPYQARSVVMAPRASEPHHPYTPWDETVIYEAHVKGFTAQLDCIPEPLRGTYSGFAHPAVTDYLRAIGVTAVELLPIHAKMSEPFLTQKGMTNYWGYSTLSYFAPEPSYATETAQLAGPVAVVQEVKDMVARLHDAGLEVILDVVYNHTCEGGVYGPAISWRGFGQTSYYMQAPDNAGAFYDTTGTGNSLDFRRQTVLRMTLDSLRYWVQEIGVDGFRFDLAATMARKGEQFDPHHPFYMALATDPVLSNVKLINEPWDLGPNGWQTGNFPRPTADWNDRFRDTVRSFWVSDQRAIAHGGLGGDLRDLATRLSGSADMFGQGRWPGGRGPNASINFITAHDGFTMRDLVSYDRKHNDANAEDNRDGTDNNRSWNHGFEGDGTAENPVPPTVLQARAQTCRNLIGTLLFSAGTPMLLAGDEFGNTQHGNNNTYCQDNEISWLNWDLTEEQRNSQATVAYLLRLRAEHRVLRPADFFTQTPSRSDSLPDLTWYADTGEPMPEHRWFDPANRVLQMLRSGRDRDADALIVINGSAQEVRIVLPEGRGNPYNLAWDSTWEKPRESEQAYRPGAATVIAPNSMRLYFANPVR